MVETYVVSGSTFTTANKVFLDLYNTSGSIIRISDIRAYPCNTAALTGSAIPVDVFRTSAVGTGGTALTAVKLDSNNPNLDAGVTARIEPSGGATLDSNPIAGANLYTEEGVNTIQTYCIYCNNGDGYVKPLTLRTNEGICIRQATFPAGFVGSIAFRVEFTGSTA